jgi:hypothetical protein
VLDHSGRITLFSLVHPETASFLHHLAQASERFAVPALPEETFVPARRALSRIERALSAPLRAVLLGESGSGKSAIANFLLGRQFMPGSMTAKTRPHVLFRYAAEPSIHTLSPNGARTRLTSKALFHFGSRPEEHGKVPKVIYSAGPRTQHEPRNSGSHTGAPALDAAGGVVQMVEVGLPHPLLQNLEIIDTSGMPDPVLANWPVFKRARLAVWCTIATQAWRETERAAWSEVPAVWRENSLLAVTYKDALRTEAERTKLNKRLENETGRLFAGRVVVCAKEACQIAGDADASRNLPRWAASGAGCMQDAVRNLYFNAAAGRLQRAQMTANRIMVKAARMIHPDHAADAGHSLRALVQ